MIAAAHIANGTLLEYVESKGIRYLLITPRMMNERIWGKSFRDPIVSRRIRDMAEYLKTTLYEYVNRYDDEFVGEISNSAIYPADYFQVEWKTCVR